MKELSDANRIRAKQEVANGMETSKRVKKLQAKYDGGGIERPAPYWDKQSPPGPQSLRGFSCPGE